MDIFGDIDKNWEYRTTGQGAQLLIQIHDELSEEFNRSYWDKFINIIDKNNSIVTLATAVISLLIVSIIALSK